VSGLEVIQRLSYKESYKRIDKKIVPDPLTKDIVIRIYNLYFEGLTYNTIAKLFNKEKDDGLSL